MLSNKVYTKKELVEILGTDRLDVIKRKLNTDGYIYSTSGRGDKLTITITDCTKPFNVFCKEELGFSPQTEFDKLKRFLRLLFYDESFARLPRAAMERKIGICNQTLTKWINRLVENNMLFLDNADNIYYVSRRMPDGSFETFEITKEEYKAAWKAYWEGRSDGYFLSVNRLYNTNQGTPHKTPKILENAFEMKRLNKLRELLKDD